MTELNDRAAKIFRRDGQWCWPYGMSAPGRDLRKRNPEQYEFHIRRVELGQRLIVEWAESYGLRTSDRGCCPRWLQGKVSRQCYPESRCTRSGVDSRWLDHPIYWLRDGRPAAITSAPYHISDDDEARLGWWLLEDPRLELGKGTGWYGMGTTQILLWRSDRIEHMEPAEPYEQ